MSDLKYRQNIIKETRSKTIFRDFVKELASWYPLVYYKSNNMISRYPKNNIISKIVNSKEFEANRNLILDKELKGDVFLNIEKLISMIPFENLKHMGENENASYNDIILYAKNTYLSSVVIEGENVMYSMGTIGSNNIYNSIFSWNGSNNVFSSRFTINSYKVFYSSYIQDCANIWFSANMTGCNECLFCNGLENKSYCIQNKQHEQEEYFRLKVKFLQQKDLFSTWHQDLLEIKGKNVGENIKGSFNYKGNNLENTYYTFQLSNARNVIFAGGGYDLENIYDCVSVGSRNDTDMCCVMGAGFNANNLYCCYETSLDTSNMYYCYYCESCSFCFGCVGLKNKQFYIYNKEYTKEEWHQKVDKLFLQMEKNKTLGKFFPGYLCPYNFNDTLAYLIDSTFTKEEIKKDGFMWRDGEIKVDISENNEIVYNNSDSLNSCNKKNVSHAKAMIIEDFQGFDEKGNWIINPEILKKVIVDDRGNYYKIMQLEYDFLIKYGLPLPEIHWLDRIKLGFKFK